MPTRMHACLPASEGCSLRSEGCLVFLVCRLAITVDLMLPWLIAVSYLSGAEDHFKQTRDGMVSEARGWRVDRHVRL